MEELRVNEVTFTEDGLLIKFMLQDEAKDFMVTERQVFLNMQGMNPLPEKVEYWVTELLGDVRELAWELAKLR